MCVCVRVIPQCVRVCLPVISGCVCVCRSVLLLRFVVGKKNKPGEEDGKNPPNPEKPDSLQ